MPVALLYILASVRVIVCPPLPVKEQSKDTLLFIIYDKVNTITWAEPAATLASLNNYIYIYIGGQPL